MAEIHEAKFAKPEVVLERLTEAVGQLHEILQAELSETLAGERRVGWAVGQESASHLHGAETFDNTLHELAPKVAELVQMYFGATAGRRACRRFILEALGNFNVQPIRGSSKSTAVAGDLPTEVASPWDDFPIREDDFDDADLPF